MTKKREFSAAEKREIVALYQQGVSVDKIRRRWKTAPTKIRDILVDAGLPIRDAAESIRLACRDMSDRERQRRAKQLAVVRKKRHNAAINYGKKPIAITFCMSVKMDAELRQYAEMKGVAIGEYCRKAMLRQIKIDRKKTKANQ